MVLLGVLDVLVELGWIEVLEAGGGLEVVEGACALVDAWALLVVALL